MHDEDADSAGNPAAAFEALRAEVAGLRRQVAALEHRAVDYTPTLRDIAERLESLEALGERPWMKLGEDELTHTLLRAGSAAMAGARAPLEQAAADVRSTGATLRRWLGEGWRMPAALVGGMVLGILLMMGLDQLYGLLDRKPPALIAGNAEKLAWCQQEAKKAGKPVPCQIVVGP